MSNIWSHTRKLWRHHSRVHRVKLFPLVCDVWAASDNETIFLTNFPTAMCENELFASCWLKQEFDFSLISHHRRVVCVWKSVQIRERFSIKKFSHTALLSQCQSAHVLDEWAACLSHWHAEVKYSRKGEQWKTQAEVMVRFNKKRCRSTQGASREHKSRERVQREWEWWGKLISF